MRFVILRHDHAATRIFIKAVYDSRPGHAADAAQPAFAMVQERIDQCACFVTRGRVHHQPRRLIQNQQRFIIGSQLNKMSTPLKQTVPLSY